MAQPKIGNAEFVAHDIVKFTGPLFQNGHQIVEFETANVYVRSPCPYPTSHRVHLQRPFSES
jgi:hypothetical protein